MALNTLDEEFSLLSSVAMIRFDQAHHDPRFFLHYLASPATQAHLKDQMSGNAITRLTLTKIKALVVPVPPTHEQRRIAAILDSVDESIRSAERLIAKLAMARTGAALDLIKDAGRGSRGADSRWRVLGSVADIVGGVALGRSLSGTGTIELPYLRVANVQDGRIDTSDIKHVRVMRNEVCRYSLQPGDFLMTEGGDFDKLGRGAVWDGSISPCLHQNHIFRIRTDRSRLLPGFLAIYAGSHDARRYFVSASKQTTNLATINMTQVRAFPLPVPPLTEQEAAIRTISIYDARARASAVELAKLRKVKEGLMEDLLTGRVRVNVGRDQAA